MTEFHSFVEGCTSQETGPGEHSRVSGAFSALQGLSLGWYYSARLFRVSVVEAFDFVLASASEIRDLDRSGTVLDGNGRKRTYAAPFRKVINIHIQRQTVAQAIDETVIHHEIHSAMSADSLGNLTDLCDERMSVFRHELSLLAIIEE